MARKVDPAPAATAAGEDLAASQLATIAPEARLEIGGRELTIREYGLFEGWEVAHKASALIADMHLMCVNGEMRYDKVRRLFGVHRDVVLPIVAQAADVEVQWIRELSRADTEVLMSTWFGVNAGFFVHEVVVEIRESARRRALGLDSTGSSSSPASPPPGSGGQTASVATPNAN